MGSACNRQKNQTVVVNIVHKQSKDLDEENQQIVTFPDTHQNSQIGMWFQFQMDVQRKETLKRKLLWTELIQEKQAEFKQEPSYMMIIEQVRKAEPRSQRIEIVDFMNYENEQGQSPRQDQVIKPETRITTQEKQIKEIFNGQCNLRDENEILLYIFKKQNPQKFREYMRNGLPFDYRWAVWKVRMHQEETYEVSLFDQLLVAPDIPKTTHDIQKDINRTFPHHPYFQNDQQGQNQLFRILRALSIRFPIVGYCQGMNFIAGFFLITNGGNDEDAFWFFNNLTESPDFMMAGLFEGTFPLTKILTEIFKQEFELKIPGLFQHMENQGIPTDLYLLSWLTTLFLYTFPFTAIYRMWDYILSKNILACVSLSLAILKYYEQALLSYDLAEFSFFLTRIHSDQIMQDSNLDIYLDIERVIQLSETEFKITTRLSPQDNESKYRRGIRLLLNK